MSLLETINSYLPPHPGLLPKWLLLVGIISLGNSIQSYLTLSYTSRVYSGPRPSSHPNLPPPPKPPHPLPPSQLPHPSVPNSPSTPLQSRTFGTYTILASLIRIYAAYNIENGPMYQLALWTYVVAWGHFMSEWLVFGSTEWGEGLAGPVIVANGSLMWMWWVWGSYVQ